MRIYENDYNKHCKHTKCDDCMRYFCGGPHNCTGNEKRCIPVVYKSIWDAVLSGGIARGYKESKKRAIAV